MKPAQDQQQQQAMDISLSRKTHRVQFCAKDRGEVLLLRGRLLLPQRCLKQHSFYSAHFIASLSKAIKTYSLIFCKKIRDFSSAQDTSVYYRASKNPFVLFRHFRHASNHEQRVSHRCFYEVFLFHLELGLLKWPGLCAACY